MYSVLRFSVQQGVKMNTFNRGLKMKKKKRLLNIIMVLIIVAVLVCGVLMAGSVRGWFDSPDMAEEAFIKAHKVTGSVFIERMGVGYELKEGSTLKSADIIETKNSSCVLQIGDSYLYVNENTELSIIENSDNKNAEITLNKGSVIVVENSDANSINIIAEDGFEASGEIYAVNIVTGAKSVCAYKSDVQVYHNGGSLEIPEANKLSVSAQADGSFDEEIYPVSVNGLSDSELQKLIALNNTNPICFDSAQMQKVIDDRLSEKLAAQKASEEADSKILAQGGTVGTTEDGKSVVAGEGSLSCTLEIRCDTILPNMKNLTAGKGQYVPANGIILSTSKIAFSEGETVFDVLNRACRLAGIQIEYSWTPLYNSYYIEGINHLYEFDCGNQSGWMYKVNGWFPNYGCSAYELKDGDVIVWTYTCNGLGADVGGSVY